MGFTKVELLMLGAPLNKDLIRRADAVTFLRGVVARKEPNYEVAAQVLRSGGVRVWAILPNFIYAGPDTVLQRIQEITTMDDKKSVGKVLQALEYFAQKEELRLQELLEESKQMIPSLPADKVVHIKQFLRQFDTSS